MSDEDTTWKKWSRRLHRGKRWSCWVKGDGGSYDIEKRNNQPRWARKDVQGRRDGYRLAARDVNQPTMIMCVCACEYRKETRRIIGVS